MLDKLFHLFDAEHFGGLVVGHEFGAELVVEGILSAG
jgi:hypothetical protein